MKINSEHRNSGDVRHQEPIRPQRERLGSAAVSPWPASVDNVLLKVVDVFILQACTKRVSSLMWRCCLLGSQGRAPHGTVSESERWAFFFSNTHWNIFIQCVQSHERVLSEPTDTWRPFINSNSITTCKMSQEAGNTYILISPVQTF